MERRDGKEEVREGSEEVQKNDFGFWRGRWWGWAVRGYSEYPEVRGGVVCCAGRRGEYGSFTTFYYSDRLERGVNCIMYSY